MSEPVKAPTKYADGLQVAIEIAEWRQRMPEIVAGKKGQCERTAAFEAGIEDVLIFLRAAHGRASKGEDYRLLSRAQ